MKASADSCTIIVQMAVCYEECLVSWMVEEFFAHNKRNWTRRMHTPKPSSEMLRWQICLCSKFLERLYMLLWTLLLHGMTVSLHLRQVCLTTSWEIEWHHKNLQHWGTDIAALAPPSRRFYFSRNVFYRFNSYSDGLNGKHCIIITLCRQEIWLKVLRMCVSCTSAPTPCKITGKSFSLRIIFISWICCVWLGLCKLCF